MIASLDRGGSEGQLVELLTRVAPALSRTTVATLAARADAAHEDALTAVGVEISALGSDRNSGLRRVLPAAMRLERLVRRTETELVYAWGPHATLIGVPLAHHAGLPVIVARRQVGLEGRRRPAFDQLVRRLEARAELATANSRAVARDALRRGVAPNRLRLVRNGHPARERWPPPAPSPVVLGYVASFRPGKGHYRLLEAATRVRADTPWLVDLTGTGPLLESVRAEVQRRRLEHRVRFVGPVRDVHGFWRSRHAAVLLSDEEGSSNALIEAGLAGRPLLATATAGNAELVVPGAGLLVPKGDPEATARALGRLIDDPRLRERLAQAAHARMRCFDAPTMAEGHLAAILEAAETGITRRCMPGARSRA